MTELSEMGKAESIISQLVEASGGRIEISQQLQQNPPKRLRIFRDPETRAFVYTTKLEEKD